LQEVRAHHEPGDVVGVAVLLAEAHARRHLQQVTERRLPVLGAGELGYVGGREVIDRANVALGDRDPDEHRGHGLGHRPRREAIPVRAAVLVALDQDAVTPRDQQAGRRVAPEVVVQRQVDGLESPGDARLGNPREARGRRRLVNEPAPEDLVEMALGADDLLDVIERPAVALRVAGAGAALFRAGPTGSEAGRGLFAGRPRVPWRCGG
jgi:hypothetical protein